MVEVHDLAAVREEPTARLREAGWQSKERLGKTIWAHPDTGFYYSEEMAVQIETRRREGEGEQC